MNNNLVKGILRQAMLILVKSYLRYHTELSRKISQEVVLEQAYQWISKRRLNAGHNNSIWHCRLHWNSLKKSITKQLREGSYHLSPLKRHFIDGQVLESWEAQDALVLKAVAIELQKILGNQMLSNCTHLKNQGGMRKSISVVNKAYPHYQFVFRSDIKSYYRNIDHQVLLKQLAEVVPDPTVLRLIQDYCERLVWVDGEYKSIKQGIPRGCSLSPLFGGWYLRQLDAVLANEQFCYTRYMDDWVVLTKTRNHLRAAVRLTHKVLKPLKVELHPTKTFIGKSEKGFDFLGYTFSPQGMKNSPQSIERFRAKLTQLYEQGADGKRVGQYVKRWRSGRIHSLLHRFVQYATGCAATRAPVRGNRTRTLVA